MWCVENGIGTRMVVNIHTNYTLQCVGYVSGALKKPYKHSSLELAPKLYEGKRNAREERVQQRRKPTHKHVPRRTEINYIYIAGVSRWQNRCCWFVAIWWGGDELMNGSRTRFLRSRYTIL